MAIDSEKFVSELTLDLNDLKQKLSEGRVKIDSFRKEATENLKLRLQVAIATLQSEIDKAKKELSAFKKAGDEKGEITARLKIADLQEKARNAKASLKDLSTQAVSTERSFFSMNSIVKDVLKVFAGFQIIRKMASALRSAFDASVSFESAFAGVRKTVEASETELLALEQGFRDLAKEIPVSVDELARIGELGGQLGIAKEGLLDFTKTISEIATASDLTEEEAATSFARIANIFQLPVEEVENLASSVIDLGNKFAATESEILDFSQRIAGAGKIAGLTTDEVAGIAAAFASVGIEAEAGGTAVQKTLITINTAVAEGGQELTNFASVAGVTASDFAALWESDPAKAFNLFIKGLKTSGDDAAAVLEELVGGDQRLARAFLSVAEAGDLLTNALDTSKTAFIENTALSAEAEKRYETTAAKIQALKNRVNDLAISLGDFLKAVLLPAAESFVTFLEAMAGAQNRMTTLANAVKILGAALITAIGGTVLAKIVKGLLGLEVTFKRVQASMKLMALEAKVSGGTVTSFIKSFATFPTVATAVILALTAIAAVAAKLKLDQIELKKSVEDLDEALKLLGTNSTNLDELSRKFKEQIVLIQQLKDEANNFDFGDESMVEKFQSFTTSFTEAKDQFILMAQASGLSEERIAELSDQFEEYRLRVNDAKEQNEFFTATAGEMGESMNLLSEKFEKNVNAIVQDSGDFEQIADAMKVTVDQMVEDLGLTGEAAEDAAEGIVESFIAKKAETESVGEALALAASYGLTSTQAKAALTNAGFIVTDTALVEMLKNAPRSGDMGELNGILFALGLEDKGVREGILAADNVGQAIIDEFNSQSGAANVSGKNVGGSLSGGIVQGLLSKYPALTSAASGIAKILNGLGANVDFGNLKKATDFLGFDDEFFDKSGLTAIKDQMLGIFDLSTQIENAIKDGEAEAATAAAQLGGGSGGGGAGTDALKEAEKAAKEAESAIEAYGKEVDQVNDATERLRDDTKNFYDDIVDSIKTAEEAQASLREEFDAFKTGKETEFAQKSGERDFELAQDEADVRADLAEELAQEEVDQEKVNELQAELNDILNERSQIQSYLNGLNEEQRAAFEEANRREGLSQFEQDQLSLEDSIKAKEDEVQAEIDKQQRIIDIQKQFLEIQNSNDQAIVEARTKLYQIANGEIIASEEERLALLEQLGLSAEALAESQIAAAEEAAGRALTEDERQAIIQENALSRVEELELLKQFQQAETLRLEAEALEKQQAELLAVKEEYILLAEQANADSVDRMLIKTQEIIDKIKEAIAAQEALNAISGAASTAASSGTTVNNEFNVSNSVDAQIVADEITSKL